MNNNLIKQRNTIKYLPFSLIPLFFVILNMPNDYSLATKGRGSGDCAKLNQKNGGKGEYPWCPDKTGQIPKKPKK